MQELRDSLSDQILTELINNTYASEQLVTISKQQVMSSFVESLHFDLPKRTRIITRQTKIPSEEYKRYIIKYNNHEIDANAEAALGYYFLTYKFAFNEEDPQWVGRSTKTALATMRKMGIVTNNNYEVIIKFIKVIIPLWKAQLMRNEPFPNNRPTIDTLFSGRRHFWSNRKVYYKRWKK